MASRPAAARSSREIPRRGCCVPHAPLRGWPARPEPGADTNLPLDLASFRPSRDLGERGYNASTGETPDGGRYGEAPGSLVRDVVAGGRRYRDRLDRTERATTPPQRTREDDRHSHVPPAGAQFLSSRRTAACARRSAEGAVSFRSSSSGEGATGGSLPEGADVVGRAPKCRSSENAVVSSVARVLPGSKRSLGAGDRHERDVAKAMTPILDGGRQLRSSASRALLP